MRVSAAPLHLGCGGLTSTQRGALLTPPADVFFEDVVELRALSEQQQLGLSPEAGESRRSQRVGDAGLAGRQPPAPSAFSQGSPAAGTVRGAGAMLERSQSAGCGSTTLAEQRLWPMPSLRTPALRAHLTTSYSSGFGWSRQRAAKVLADLEREGLVRAAVRPGPNGRPRKVCRSHSPPGRMEPRGPRITQGGQQPCSDVNVRAVGGLPRPRSTNWPGPKYVEARLAYWSGQKGRVALIGDSGAGKSSVMAAVLGAFSPSVPENIESRHGSRWRYLGTTRSPPWAASAAMSSITSSTPRRLKR